MALDKNLTILTQKAVAQSQLDTKAVERAKKMIAATKQAAKNPTK
jgi:hypothetical protein